jgi:hypothetical protein
MPSGDLDAPYAPELQAWLDGDPRRPGAFLRAQAALSFLDRARALEDRAGKDDSEAGRPASKAMFKDKTPYWAPAMPVKAAPAKTKG